MTAAGNADTAATAAEDGTGDCGDPADRRNVGQRLAEKARDQLPTWRMPAYMDAKAASEAAAEADNVTDAVRAQVDSQGQGCTAAQAAEMMTAATDGLGRKVLLRRKLRVV